MRQAPHAENCWREDLGWAEARRVVVEGYGGLAEPGLLGTEADLRGMRERWMGGGVVVMVAVEWEEVQRGGIFEGLGMNEEGRRALGRGEAQR
jgi:hypothetical protein